MRARTHPQGVAGDRGDDRLRDAGHRADRAHERTGALDHVGVGHGLHLLDVGPGREDPLAAVDDDRLDVGARRRLLRSGPDLLLDLHVEGIHLGPVEADRADAVLDLEADELAHQTGCGARLALGGQPRLEEEADALEDVVDRQRHEDVEVGVRGDDVLGRDHEALLHEGHLDDVELHRHVVAAGQTLVAVRRDGLRELPLTEEAHEGEVTLGDAGEEGGARALVVDDGELDVAVVIDGGSDLEALEDADDAVTHRGVAHGSAVGRGRRCLRREVGQRSGVSHAPNRRLRRRTHAR